MSGSLEFMSVNGAAAHFLDGAPLRHGDPVELLLQDDRWVRGVYEWSGHENRWPGFRFALGGSGPAYASANSRTAVVALPPDAVLRRVRPRT
jgi:DNA-binding IclR family transcriptional regulator